MATLGDKTAAFVQELEDERDLTVEYLGLSRHQRAAKLDALHDQQRDTDRAAAAARSALGAVDAADYSDQVQAKLRDVRYRLDTLGTIRKLSGPTSESEAVTLDVYSQFIGSLVDLDDLIAQGSPDAALTENTRAFAALARAKDYASQERARLEVAILAGRFATPADRERLQTLRSQQDSQIAVFRTAASTDERQRYEDVVTGSDIGQVELIYQQALIRSDSSPALSVRPLRPHDAAQWTKASGTRIDQMRTAERELAVGIVTSAHDLKQDAWRKAVIDAAVLVVGLLLAALFTVVVARSLVRPLRRLQVGALEVADNRLPSLVDRLRDPGAASGGIEVEPIDVHSADEIGQVARAFDEVHREAVRLAADEAVLRGNINAMFVNLSRRSQTLIERQLQLIEELEHSERDEEQLANLFRLDHLATRMRRNCENLLVLGGQDQVRRRNRPVPLIDVVRASLSEVEQYERVALTVRADMTVAGAAVNDLVHLLAELVENATTFSDKRTKVTISGQQLSGGGALLQITDNGVGMPPDELDEANQRLASPPVIDFSAARRMGLFVVGRLAVRHGIRVELRAAQGGGLTAFVVLPESVIGGTAGGGVGSRGFAPGLGAAEPVPAVAAPDSPALLERGFGQDPAQSATGGFPVGGPVGGPVGQVNGWGRGTGPQQALRGDTGSFPAVPAPREEPGPFPAGRGDTGSFPAVRGDTGSFPAVRGDTGPFPAVRSDTGAFPSLGDTGSIPAVQDTGSLPAVGDEESNTGSTTGSTTGGFPVPRADTGPQPAVPADDRPLPDLPVRTPGAQLPGRPNQALAGDDLFRPPVRSAGEPVPAAPPNARPLPPGDQPGDEPPRRPFTWESGPLQTMPEDEPPLARPRPEPARPPAAPPAQPPAAPPVLSRHKSPIFDAMRSEWFERGGDDGQRDPVRGWESPADAGFQAAESARKPVQGERTRVGLPKRVPGQNRVPGAVRGAGRQGQQGQPTPGAPAPGPQREHGISADAVRDRFSGLQRGVRRGRQEIGGGPADGDNEGPSRRDGETGGSR
ncbi:sensor histidine kinase [Actinomadura atramentaria]|uniref:sensor histidine kinase n=1 Tax=Actinomadura atramentaria TaxID=1990 RepID=UPI00196A0212|nr:sensor histidine kinase [Actinomadura atramentaria]